MPRLAPLDPRALDCLDDATLRALLTRETRLWAHIARLHAAPWWDGPYPEEIRQWLPTPSEP